jgi:hypothetical protein
MQYVALIYIDSKLLDALPVGQADSMMRDCFQHADHLKRNGRLTGSTQLEGVESAKSVRTRNGRTTITDGPFAEAKEVLGGFNLIEADSMDEAVRIAAGFPWAQTGCVEVRPLRDLNTVRQRVGAPAG